MRMKPWKGGGRSSLAALCLLVGAILSCAGSALAQSQKSEDKKLDEELKRLKAKFTSFKPPKGKLDPWLRLHLYAMRLEEEYAGFEKTFGITDEDFDPTKQKEGVPMGGGPYLGMPLKFTVL